MFIVLKGDKSCQSQSIAYKIRVADKISSLKENYLWKDQQNKMSCSRLPLAFLILGLLLVSSQSLTTYVYNFDTLTKYTPVFDLGYIMSGTSIMLNVSTSSTVLKFTDTSFIFSTGYYPYPDTVLTLNTSTCGVGGVVSCTVVYNVVISGPYKISLNFTNYASTPSLTAGTSPNQMQLFQMTVTSYLTLSGGPSNSSAAINTLLKVSDTFRDRVAKLIYLDSTQTSSFTIYPYPTTLSSTLIAANSALIAASTAKSLVAACQTAVDAAKAAATLAVTAANDMAAAETDSTGITVVSDPAYLNTTAATAETAATAVVDAMTADAGNPSTVTTVFNLVNTAVGLTQTAVASTIGNIAVNAAAALTALDNADIDALALVANYSATLPTSTDAKAIDLVAAAVASKTYADAAVAAALAQKVAVNSTTPAAKVTAIDNLIVKTNAYAAAASTAKILADAAKVAADSASAAVNKTQLLTKAALDAMTTINTTAEAAIGNDTALAALLLDKSSLIKLSLFPTASTASPYSISGTTDSLTTNTLSYNATTQTMTASVSRPQGYYVLVASYDIPNINFIRITFTSNNYSCPYNSLFPDLYQNFQPCSSSANDQSVQPGFPCLSLNSATKICVACVSGYVLTNGICLVNTTCPSGQYYHFGNCILVDVSCNKYDSFTGACTTCKDATFIIVNGKCVAPDVSCTARQYKVNNICFNASDLCKTFDAAGLCTSCNDGYELKNGICSLIVPVCTEKQYLKDNICKNIPVNCPNFDIKSESCLLCDRGYYVSNGVCQKIECPAGQVPSTYGIFCVSVSPLCSTYDPLTGDCLTCKNQDEIVSNGVCIQISSAVAGCMAREKLGFGPCTDAMKNCQQYNLQSGECQQCVTGWFKDYTGRCNLQNAVCQSDEVSIEGICVQIPQNCLRVDNIGLCTVCQSSDYGIVNGQCVFKKTCGANQYLGDNGQCVEVAPGCSSFNPTTGSCLVCANGSPANNGLCCPDGYAVLSGQCVDPDTYQSIKSAADTSSAPTCVAYHPSLGTCLACNGNFQVDPTTGNTCI